MARVFDLKTRQERPAEPLSKAKRVVLGVKHNANMRFTRDELCVTLVRITAACEDVSRGEQYDPTLRSFANATLEEIEALITKIGGPRS